MQCQEGMKSKAKKYKEVSVLLFAASDMKVQSEYPEYYYPSHLTNKYQQATTCLTVTAGSNIKKCPYFY